MPRGVRHVVRVPDTIDDLRQSLYLLPSKNSEVRIVLLLSVCSASIDTIAASTQHRQWMDLCSATVHRNTCADVCFLGPKSSAHTFVSLCTPTF